MFSGDLNVPPVDGLEQFKGWYTSFYDFADGLPKNISVASQLNPFLYNATAAVVSDYLQDLEYWDSPDVDNGALVDVGSNRIAFAVSCESTVWDVRFSLVNGSIIQFNATMSDPRKASIIKAPLQVGFGRHALFEAASLAVASVYSDGNYTLSNEMGITFSQIGIALGFGAFNYSLSELIRYRWDEPVTRVPKAPLWFLVITCLFYAVVTSGIATAAISLRRIKSYSEAQYELLPREPISLKKIVLSLDMLKAADDLVKPDNGWGSLPFVQEEENALRSDLGLRS
jgi:hypothetical protein